MSHISNTSQSESKTYYHLISSTPKKRSKIEMPVECPTSLRSLVHCLQPGTTGKAAKCFPKSSGVAQKWFWPPVRIRRIYVAKVYQLWVITEEGSSLHRLFGRKSLITDKIPGAVYFFWDFLNEEIKPNSSLFSCYQLIVCNQYHPFQYPRISNSNEINQRTPKIEPNPTGTVGFRKYA